MNLFFKQKKQSKDGQKRERSLILSSEANPNDVFCLADCDMTDVPSGIYFKCNNLRKTCLDLSNNRLKELSNASNPIKYLCGLEQLNVASNNIKSLPPDIDQLAHLRVLNLADNVKFGDLESIMKLASLEELYLTNTLIKELPVAIGNLKNLTLVEIDQLPRGNVDKVKKQLVNLDLNPALDTIDLSNCDLWTVPDGIYIKMSILCKRSINLSHNELIQIEHDKSQLADVAGALVELNLASNRLSRLPDTLAQCAHLVHLDLSHNFLRHFPPVLFQLSTLEYLNLDNNPLDDIPDDIVKLLKLEELTLTNTSIEELPSNQATKAYLLALPCFLSDLAISNPKSPTTKSSYSSSKSSSRNRSRKTSASGHIVDIFALNEERERQHLLASQHEKAAAQEQLHLARLKMEDDEMKDKAARLRAQASEDEKAIFKVQSELEEENRQFMAELARAKNEADKFTKAHLERQAARDELDIIEFLKRNEQEHVDYFKVTEEQTAEIDEEYLKTAMKHLFDEKERFKQLFKRVKAEDEETDAKIREYLAQERLPVVTEELDASGLIEVEQMQKMAFIKLVEQQDDELAQIRENQAHAERELAELTRLEVARKEKDDAASLEWLEERRLALSELLGTFLKQEKERNEQMHALMIKMDEQREQDQAMFWLVQFQRLLQEKPVALRQLEAQLEPEINQLLVRARVSDGVAETFATHRITSDQLIHLTDEKLKSIGINAAGDRRRILDEIERGPISIDKATAPTEKEVEAHHSVEQPSIRVTVPSPTTATAPESSNQEEPAPVDEDDECCICMDARRGCVFLPCGHVCTCTTCAADLVECPLCRGTITQKIAIYR